MITRYDDVTAAVITLRLGISCVAMTTSESLLVPQPQLRPHVYLSALYSHGTPTSYVTSSRNAVVVHPSHGTEVPHFIHPFHRYTTSL